jgi:hypothetical protein
MITIPARNLTLENVHRLLQYQRSRQDSFNTYLNLEPLTAWEEREVSQIREDFENYLIEGKVSEGQVKLLTVVPLLRLAGFHKAPIKILLEERITDILIEEEDLIITGRLDLLMVNKDSRSIASTSLWIVIVETKNSQAEVTTGLAQLLTYAFESLQSQSSVWGLVANGIRWDFVYISAGDPPSYQLLPSLHFMEIEPSRMTLQVLQAIHTSRFS